MEKEHVQKTVLYGYKFTTCIIHYALIMTAVRFAQRSKLTITWASTLCRNRKIADPNTSCQPLESAPKEALASLNVNRNIIKILEQNVFKRKFIDAIENK